MEELHRHPLQAWSSQTNSQDTPRFSSILQVLPKPFYQLFRRVSTSPRPSCAAKLHLLVLGPRLPKEKPPDCWSLPPRPFKTTISSPQFSHFLSDALSKVSTVILANVGPKGDRSQGLLREHFPCLFPPHPAGRPPSAPPPPGPSIPILSRTISLFSISFSQSSPSLCPEPGPSVGSAEKRPRDQPWHPRSSRPNVLAWAGGRLNFNWVKATTQAQERDCLKCISLFLS